MADELDDGGDAQKARRPTLQTVADAAGVDVSTVSRVLNSAPDARTRWASQATIDRILHCSAEVGYRRNPHGASLRTSRSLHVGVIVPRLQDYVLATIYEGIEAEAASRGYAAFVANSLDDDAQRAARIRQFLDRRVDGLIVADAHVDDPLLDRLATEHVPFVLASRASSTHPGAFSDDRAGGALVAEHLVGQGRRDIAVVAGHEFASTAVDRVAGLREALDAHGVPLGAHRVVHRGFDAEAGRSGADAILAAGRAPDAIFATNDFAAIGVMGALRERGVRVPDDVAVVGYNDTPLAASLPVPLTTVRSPMEAIGRAAFALLESRLSGGTPTSRLFEPQLVARASSATAAHGGERDWTL